MSELNSYFRSELNLRDLGGYVMEDGRRIKSGMIYRSGGLFLMNESEIEHLNALHLRTILDLRTQTEASRRQDPLPQGVQYLQASGVLNKYGKEIDFSPSGMRQNGEEGKAQLSSLKHYYMEMPYDNGAFHLLFEELLKQAAPLLFHCASGKDRTGVAAMLVMKALGAGDEVTIQDYMLSNVYRRHLIEKAELKDGEEMKNDPVFAELIHMQKGVSEEIGWMVLNGIIARSHSYEQFFQEQYGLDSSKLNELRNDYLE
ncbi:MAG: tyrosine-protein phosphatase [Solobacterium sp.]|nr:tyrosine-protein phosphatase [Solobacterium sp.]MCH4221785.1 tyrosine-protein phosphatase [Solobacterium sp.]MCH4265007.1 tyrosine-protein phosphatase [Solobacterium sp.]